MSPKKIPRVEIVCVGTELLTGKVNTHVAALGPRLQEVGLSMAREQTVGDDPVLMREVFQESFRRADIIISAGGLGPTFDDITREAWSDVTHRSLVFHPRILRGIERKFLQRQYKMPEINRRQAYLLKGAKEIPNPNGTAPGQFLRLGKKSLFLLPGPGRELFPMMDQFVLPKIRSLYPLLFSKTKSFFLVGLPESKVDEMIRPVVENIQIMNQCQVIHGILASQSIIQVKFTVQGRSKKVVQKTVQALSGQIRKLIGPYVFGEDRETLESVIGAALRQRRETVAVAESCTGGLISKILTDQPGASDYFLEGAVTYHNKSKQKRLGVQVETLKKFGAVSEPVARQMAEGLRRGSGARYSLSVTGIAGPGGGSNKKPVGLVYIGCSSPRGTAVKEFRFQGDRAWIRHRAAIMALDILRKEILGAR